MLSNLNLQEAIGLLLYRKYTMLKKTQKNELILKYSYRINYKMKKRMWSVLYKKRVFEPVI